MINQIVVRQFIQKDQQFLIKLDRAAQMDTYLMGLIYFGRNCQIPYSQLIIAKGYKQGIILVAQLNNIPIGKVVIVFKSIKVFEQQEKAGYLFDLRVHAQYQRKGIGTRLINQAQKQLRKKQITFLYCSTNWKLSSNSKRSVNFFQKLNWTIGSQRYFVTSYQEKNIKPCRAIFLYNGSKALYSFNKQSNSLKIRKVQKQMDLSIIDGQLSYHDSKNYLGTAILQSQNEQCGVSLFQDNLQFSITMQRLFFHKDTWQSGKANIIINTFFLIPVFLLIYSLSLLKQQKIRYELINSKITIFLVISLVLFLIIKTIRDQFQKSIQTHCGKVIRLCNPYYKGKQQFEDDLFSQLISNVKLQAVQLGYRRSRINIDLKDPLQKYFDGKNGFHNLYSQQKRMAVYFYTYLDERQHKNERINNKVYFDARDQ